MRYRTLLRAPGRGPGCRKAEGGVTLPEMLIVMAIMGLLMLIAIPSVSNYIRAAKVRVSNDGIVGDLRVARYIAITNRTTSTVTFDSTGKSWSYTDIHGRAVTRRLEPGISFATLTNVPVTFKADGSLSTSPATIRIESMVTGSVRHEFTITVNSVGKVSSTFVRY